MNIQSFPLAQRREVILAALHTGQAVVEFTKVNGELRKMPSTLDAALIPPAPAKVVTETGKPERKVSLDTVRVYCTDKKEWRSFRVDSVISITKDDE